MVSLCHAVQDFIDSYINDSLSADMQIAWKIMALPRMGLVARLMQPIYAQLMLHDCRAINAGMEMSGQSFK